jgi:hypothetical protein
MDVKQQSREHRLEIHKAMRSGDMDVALTRLNKRNSYNYW